MAACGNLVSPAIPMAGRSDRGLRFGAGFLKNLAEVWASHGKQTMISTAQTNPAVFFATCARLIGPEVKLTVEQPLPGNL
jgi:hypothetical protein